MTVSGTASWPVEVPGVNGSVHIGFASTTVSLVLDPTRDDYRDGELKIESPLLSVLTDESNCPDCGQRSAPAYVVIDGRRVDVGTVTGCHRCAPELFSTPGGATDDEGR